MRVLDFFCKAGGCTRGYQQAGYEVVGVDIEPQPRYVGEEFYQEDALFVLDTLCAGLPWHGYTLADFLFIHASPPCQAYSAATFTSRSTGFVYPDLLPVTRSLLIATGLPWVIENVIGAPVQSGVILCGSMFGLQVRRHRHFETSHMLFTPGPCRHDKNFYTIFGESVMRQKSNPVYTGKGCGVASKIETRFSHDIGLQAMGIDWMTPKELSQAIPPAYTKWIGEQMKFVLVKV